MEAICVFCGTKVDIPVEEVVIHQPATLTMRPVGTPEPYAEFKICCPSCTKVFSYPCGIWHGGYGESDKTQVTMKKDEVKKTTGVAPEQKLLRAIFGEPAR